jgi:hypothetical protein
VVKKKSIRKQKERRPRKKERAQRRNRLLLSGISILLLLTLALPVFVTGGRTSSPRPAGSEVHWHIGLSVVVNGETVAVPDLENDRFLDVRDSATTLPGALAAHGVRLTETCLNDNCIDDGGKLTVSVNGQAIDDFTRYVLREEDEVRIEFSAA